MIPFHVPTPQGCNIQTFYGTVPNTSDVTYQNHQSWNKPVGVSHVYMMLIGGGARGSATRGGGSGAVTVWYGAAQHVPDSLFVRAPTKNDTTSDFGDTTVSIRTTAGTVYDLLTAQTGRSTAGGDAMTANAFAASGFFQSVAGQDGDTGAISPSSTTFLSGGANTNSSIANYGYTGGSNSNGYFIMQPIIVGVGGKSSGTDGGLGCGTYRNEGYAGGGLVLIASW